MNAPTDDIDGDSRPGGMGLMPVPTNCPVRRRRRPRRHHQLEIHCSTSQ
ncbi:MAG: hypothetical protein R2867_39765 [Caldilineaceae bacterium]